MNGNKISQEDEEYNQEQGFCSQWRRWSEEENGYGNFQSQFDP